MLRNFPKLKLNTVRKNPGVHHVGRERADGHSRSHETRGHKTHGPGLVAENLVDGGNLPFDLLCVPELVALDVRRGALD